MLKINQKGDFSKITSYLTRVEDLKKVIKSGSLDIFGVKGVQALSAVTPRDTGKTATSWYYEIKEDKDKISLVFKNSNVVNGVPIAVILQYGHGTKNGGYVQGIDYINPVIRPLFEEIAQGAWREVTKK